MKILFCTNIFQVVENGPVKFARLLPQINQHYPDHTLRILTEDTAEPNHDVFKVNIPSFWKNSFLSQFIRMWYYHRMAMKVRKLFPFDVLVYNHALVGLVSTLIFNNTVVMVNDDNNIEALRHKLFTRNGLKRRTFRVSERLSCRRARLVLVNSNYLKTQLISTYQLSGNKVKRLYKGTEIRNLSIPKSLNTSIPVKNDIRRGGIDTLSKAVSRLKHHCEIIVAGNNSQDCLYIESLFQSENVTKLTIKGKISQKEVSLLLSESDIFCVPSFQEALGVANLEALAHGIPVVSTMVGGIPEVTDGNNGAWLVPPGHPEHLSEALEECIENDKMRRKKTAHGLTHIKQFSESHVLLNFIDILANIEA